MISTEEKMQWVSDAELKINWEKLNAEKSKILRRDFLIASVKHIALMLLALKDESNFKVSDLVDIYGENWWSVYCGLNGLKDFGYITETPKSTKPETQRTVYTTYVYLMKDTVNNFFKIGKSNHPKIREKTLQSEKPTIELVIAWEGNPAEEAELHKLFQHKRIRGEWFSLTPQDIKIINEKFAERKNLFDNTASNN